MAHRFSGARLRLLREARGLRREQLAVYVDRSYGLEVRWERDLAVPTANDLPRIAEVLNVDVDALYDEPIPA